MRLFIALPVTEGANRTLQKTQEALQRMGVDGRFTPPENRHLTLAFLGDAEDPAPAMKALRSVKIPRTSLIFDRLTLFGDVLVAVFKKNDALERYAAALRAALDAAGVSYDRKAFRPHITLCRGTAIPRRDLLRLNVAERSLRGKRMPVTEARLYASDLSGKTPRYDMIAPPTGS